MGTFEVWNSKRGGIYYPIDALWRRGSRASAAKGEVQRTEFDRPQKIQFRNQVTVRLVDMELPSKLGGINQGRRLHKCNYRAATLSRFCSAARRSTTAD
jgi:hypothetical protein